MRRWTQAACGLALLVGLGACANGDFGRVKPSLVDDGLHNWVGRQAARESGSAPSSSHLTDEERALRDLAYPLIQPPYSRGQWDSVLYEAGLAPTRGIRWPRFDQAAYGRHLLSSSFRSPEARYARLIDDIRNDGDRIDQFVSVARHVLDMDRRRARVMAYASGPTDREIGSARRRIHENSAVVIWVGRSLAEREAGYRFALERMVVDTPSAKAVEAERALNLLRQRVAAARLG